MKDFDLTALMKRENIAKVERFPPVWGVVLLDGRQASGATVGEALEKAKRTDAENVRRIAA